ncbi:zinc-binding dehydrogenase [Plectosphaerella plurivora]|uniref:alcohol dehydrogenase (NADP(+)) n=1 Tax=Plectosphaerella plurivora TaxID=936078 RepID=A0A9P8VH29_9PEZI|nr:zinc-binding dehydrogenase [Plectosphaerella plurivora]
MDPKFEGWVGLGPDAAAGRMVWQSFEPKPWEESDVDIKVTHTSVCGTDLHVLKGEFGSSHFPICVGHEIVGVVVKVGSKAVGHLEIGDRVGVGAQGDACLNRDGNCQACSEGQENYCPSAIYTYACVHRNGGKAMGGHGLYHRAPSHFVFRIPDGLSSEAAAPMLCAGITTFSPLQRHGAGPGKTVGIIGLGGLGHFAVLWAKALGAEKIVAISRKEDKRQDAVALGADIYMATDDEPDWASRSRASLDLIISTVSSTKMPFTEYLSLLRLGGTFVQLGAPDGPLPLPVSPLMQNRINVTGSGIGSPSEIRQMMDLAVKMNVMPWVSCCPMKEANQVLVDFEEGKAKYRYVLVNEDN